MNTPHVVVLAQGVQSRLPDLDGPKQLLPLPACGNTPIIVRTLRQVWEIAQTSCEVVTWPAVVGELWRQVQDVRHRPLCTALRDPGNSSLKGIARFLEQVSHNRVAARKADRTVVLLGDVVYSWACLRALFAPACELDLRPHRFAGTTDISPSGGELWGLAWEDSASDLMVSSLAAALKKHPPFDDTYQPGQLRRWMWAVHPQLQTTSRYVAIDDYTRDIDTPEHVLMIPGLSAVAAADDAAHGVTW